MSYPSRTYLHNKNLKELLDDVIAAVNRQNNTTVLGNPTLAIGTSSKAKVKNSAFAVMVDGVITAISATETAFTATTHDIADGKEAIFLVYLDGSTITLLKGDDADADEAVCPDTPAGKVKIGEVKIAASGAIFNATTDDLDAAHITDTYTNKIDLVAELEPLA